MNMSSISRKLLLSMSLVFLVAGGCEDRQEPAPPERPVVVRKRIEAPQPLTAQTVKPGNQEAAVVVTKRGPLETEAPEPPRMELAEAKPPAKEEPPSEVTVEPEEVMEKPDKGAGPATGSSSERLSVPETPHSGTFTITLASFKPKQRADRYVEELKKLGIDAYVLEVNLPEKGRWHRVSVGGFPTLKEAKDYKKELEQKGISGTYITKITESP